MQKKSWIYGRYNCLSDFIAEFHYIRFKCFNVVIVSLRFAKLFVIVKRRCFLINQVFKYTICLLVLKKIRFELFNILDTALF